MNTRLRTARRPSQDYIKRSHNSLKIRAHGAVTGKNYLYCDFPLTPGSPVSCPVSYADPAPGAFERLLQ